MILKNLTQDSFAKYGTIIGPKSGQKGFDVVLGDGAARGWRIGYSVLKRKPLMQIEAHPDSLETFEPVSGTMIIYVAPKENPEAGEAFLLDKPVCVNKLIWHDVVAISEEAHVKIMENYVIEGTLYHDLKTPLDTFVSEK